MKLDKFAKAAVRSLWWGNVPDHFFFGPNVIARTTQVDVSEKERKIKKKHKNAALNQNKELQLNKQKRKSDIRPFSNNKKKTKQMGLWEFWVCSY